MSKLCHSYPFIHFHTQPFLVFIQASFLPSAPALIKIVRRSSFPIHPRLFLAYNLGKSFFYFLFLTPYVSVSAFYLRLVVVINMLMIWWTSGEHVNLNLHIKITPLELFLVLQCKCSCAMLKCVEANSYGYQPGLPGLTKIIQMLNKTGTIPKPKTFPFRNGIIQHLLRKSDAS